MIKPKPKVSIAVISYNSNSTIVETLNSILNQDYGAHNIELVISDDGSNDKTVTTVKSWLKTNASSFFKVKTFFNNKNQGVPHNCNIAWKACEQLWIKSIAADDILLSHCISSFISFVSENSDAKVIFSYMKWFGEIEDITPKIYQLDFFSQCASEQHEHLKYFSFNIAPTSFIHNETLKSIEYADERYTLFEDLPLWLKFTSNNIKLYFNNEITVRYRIGDSISKTSDRFINVNFVKNCIQLNKDYKLEKFPSIKWFLKNEELFLYHSQILLVKLFKNKRNPNFYIYRLLWFFVPFTVFSKLKIKLKRTIFIKTNDPLK